MSFKKPTILQIGLPEDIDEYLEDGKFYKLTMIIKRSSQITSTCRIELEHYPLSKGDDLNNEFINNKAKKPI